MRGKFGARANDRVEPERQPAGHEIGNDGDGDDQQHAGRIGEAPRDRSRRRHKRRTRDDEYAHREAQHRQIAADHRRHADQQAGQERPPRAAVAAAEQQQRSRQQRHAQKLGHERRRQHRHHRRRNQRGDEGGELVLRDQLGRPVDEVRRQDDAEISGHSKRGDRAAQELDGAGIRRVRERRFAVPDPVIGQKAVADALAHDDERAFVPVDGVGKKEWQPEDQCPQAQRGDDRDLRPRDGVQAGSHSSRIPMNGISSAGGLGVLPPPLWGKGGEGGRCCCAGCVRQFAIPPQPPTRTRVYPSSPFEVAED